MLIIDEISVSYKRKGSQVPVLSDFSLNLGEGEILAVLGPSGCGKSTLIQVLAGMLLPDSGAVYMEGEGANVPLNPKFHKIAVIPQNCGLLPWKTLRQNCLLPLKLRNRHVEEAKKAELEEMCRELQLDTLLERYPRELSGGQVQRGAIARAFLQEPDLLLMDEPFSSLDAITRLDGWELFLKIWRQKKPTTILVTHSMEEALYLGKEILVLGREGGRQLARIQNPYFGEMEPEEGDFLVQKKRLHKLLQADENEREVQF
ncbi:ATP-binding cassette domain-containing protein [Konateibacter massiliensis]|uniref:ATP-binding cassette domain-containing protein n=1 Tax=Konateibacter massiliensis TaxID=2002841 RepID=UPI000C14774F|nr:ATP-binding cassette domain-containing protein [Konateibacter massiliensis]